MIDESQLVQKNEEKEIKNHSILLILNQADCKSSSAKEYFDNYIIFPF